MARNFKVFREWMRALLQKRGLDQPDGRSLYQFRLNETEFNDLETLLRHWLELFIGAVDLGQITQVTGFPALFVLYAAEWWRRRYDGRGFSWEPILRDLGADPSDWTPGQRSECVRRGLKEWQLKPKDTGALRYLGTVAVQGGLPLRLLAEARGGVGRVLQRVLHLAEGHTVSRTELVSWITSLQSRLPKSYRQEAIYSLLAEIVEVVLALKQEAGLKPDQDAIAILNQRIPDWKERFPLSLEDRHAQSLMEQLVTEAARIRVRQAKSVLPLQRLLEPLEKRHYRLVARLDLPKILEIQALTALFDVAESDLPRVATLSLQAGEKRFETTIRRLVGQSYYRIGTPGLWETEGDEALSAYVLQLSAPDGRVWSVEAPLGGEIDSDLPWSFAAEEPHSWLRQGGKGVVAQDTWLALPPGWRVHKEKEDDCGIINSVGQLDVPSRQIVLVRGVLKIEDEAGNCYSFRTGQAGAGASHWAWVGERVWLEFRGPARAYRGMPRLFRIDDSGQSTPAKGELVCSVIGNRKAKAIIGPVTLTYQERGAPPLRTRIVLLPQQAELTLKARDARSGVVRFDGWGLHTVKVTNAEVYPSLSVTQNRLELHVSVPEGQPVPQHLSLEVYWPHTPHPVRLQIPFPAKGVRAFAADGRELYSGERLTFQRLRGVRLILYGNNHAVLCLGSHRNWNRRYWLRNSPGALSLEIRLADYWRDIQQLLSCDDDCDAMVPITVQMGGQECFLLRITRYGAVLEHDTRHVFLEGNAFKGVSANQMERLSIMVMRLEHPEDEPVVLQPLISEGVSSRAWDFGPERWEPGTRLEVARKLWDFKPEQREPGTWFIYPGPEASLPVRPTLWPVAGEDEETSLLAQAIRLADPVEREVAIDRMIALMADDYNHPDWIMVERLAAQLEHLPLATLDLWRRFAHSFPGMAALALRLGNLPQGFCHRFAEELPFSWEIVPYRCWCGAIGRLRDQCLNTYGEEAGKLVFQSHLQNQREALWAETGALHYLLGLASAAFDAEMGRQAEILRILGTKARVRLFDGADSELMKLRRNHADDEWPTGFDPLLRYARDWGDLNRWLCPESFGHQDGIINVPLLAAALAVTGDGYDCFADAGNVHLLRTARAFDPDWFDEAYNQTVARCWAEGWMKDA